MLRLPEQFACYVQGTAGHPCETLIVAESSGEWGLFWRPSEWGTGGCVTTNSKTKRSEVIGRASEVEMIIIFFLNVQ